MQPPLPAPVSTHLKGSDLGTLALTHVDVQVDEPYLLEVDPVDLARAAAAALAREKRTDAVVTVVVTTDESVAALNEQYRRIPGPTDVLSFSAQEPAAGFVSVPEAMASYLGDVVIALPYTRRQAEEAERDLDEELRLLVVHGVLHLLGYDHDEPPAEGDQPIARGVPDPANRSGLRDRGTGCEESPLPAGSAPSATMWARQAEIVAALAPGGAA